MHTLSDSLDLVLPDVPEALVPRALHDDLRRLAGDLPAVVRCGFEVRLGRSQQVDFQQGFVARHGDLRRLHDHLRQAEPLAGAWTALDRLLVRCNDPSSRLGGCIRDLWLELDRPPMNALSVFVGFNAHRSTSETGAAAHETLDALMGRAAWNAWRDSLDRCFDACRPHANVSHLGVMIGRSSPFLRVNVRPIADDLVRAYLDAIGWDGDAEACAQLVAEMRSLTGSVTLCFDVADGVAPRLGIECHLSDQVALAAAWNPLFDELIARGWCTPPKRDAVLGWPGLMTPPDAASAWPAHLLHAELRVPADHFTSLEKLVAHVKVTREDDGAVEAKAYFGFVHTWVRPELENDPPRPKEVTARPPSRDIGGAIAGGVDFLLASRTRAGWWREFSGFRQSDEWVSAYVATTLTAAGDRRAIDAARGTWDLLVDRRSPVAGWGWNRRLPVDADSTAWGLRLAARLGLLESAPARAARRVLLAYEQPDGGMTTYLPAASSDLARRNIRSPNGSYDGWCRTSHQCVTAAVAPFSGDRQLEFLRNTQRADGSWEAYWWDDDEYATALAAEALAAADVEGNAAPIDAAIDWGLGRFEARAESAFATAWCVRLALLRPADRRSRSSLRRGVRRLLEMQQSDGSWPASARLLAPRPDLQVRRVEAAPTAETVDDARIFTTATVLSALIGLQPVEV